MESKRLMNWLIQLTRQEFVGQPWQQTSGVVHGKMRHVTRMGHTMRAPGTLGEHYIYVLDVKTDNDLLLPLKVEKSFWDMVKDRRKLPLKFRTSKIDKQRHQYQIDWDQIQFTFRIKK